MADGDMHTAFDGLTGEVIMTRERIITGTLTFPDGTVKHGAVLRLCFPKPFANATITSAKDCRTGAVFRPYADRIAGGEITS